MKPRTFLLVLSLLVNAFTVALLLKQPGGLSGAFAAVGRKGSFGTAGDFTDARPRAGKIGRAHV